MVNADVGDHQIKAIVTDNNSVQGTSQTVNISVEEVKSCSEASSQATQGTFSTGYTVLYETVGNSVSVTFELLDTNKAGAVAYLWKESPFEESQMENIGGRKFKKIIGGVSTGETISYACKFAYS